MSLLSVVVPVYKNASDLPELWRRLRLACDGVEGLESEFIFVDDGSEDDSFDQLSRLAAADPRLRVLRFSRNFGSNAAIVAGLTHASGEAAVVIAADLQDPPELIPELVGRWRSGSEIVLAARKTREDPLATRLFAALFNRLFRLLVFRDFPRDGFDFMLLDRRVVSTLIAMPEKHSYVFGQVIWVGFRKSIVYYKRERRPHGRSGWTFWRKVKYFIDAFTAFSYLPLRLASVLGFLLAGSGFTYAMLLIVLRLRGDVPGHGYAALVVTVLVVSGVQLVMTGIIGEYLWRVLEEVRPRPAFIVAAAINLPGPGVRPARERDGEPAVLAATRSEVGVAKSQGA